MHCVAGTEVCTGTTTTAGGATYNYSYDGDGNRLSDNTGTYTYNSADQILASPNNGTASYELRTVAEQATELILETDIKV